MSSPEAAAAAPDPCTGTGTPPGKPSGGPGPLEDDPWALSLVVRVERDAPPSATDVLEAAAGAVVALLVDRRTIAPAGELHEAVVRWREGRIRKIARRARGVRWERTAALPHVEVTAGTATVRAFAPHPLGAAPPQLQTLQVGGLQLVDPPDRVPALLPEPALTVRLSPDVVMSTGKAVAQVGHAAQLAVEELERSTVFGWLAAGAAVRVITGAPVVSRGARVDVHDGGYTEVAPGTLTASAAFEGAASDRSPPQGPGPRGQDRPATMDR